MLQHRRDTEHPDANLLSAFAERRLSRAEKAAVWSHLAHCPECRAVLASAFAAGESETAVENGLAESRWWTWRWMTAAAAACLILTIVIWRPVALRQREAPSRPEINQRSTIAVQTAPRQFAAIQNGARASKPLPQPAAKSRSRVVKKFSLARNSAVAQTTPATPVRPDAIAGAQAATGAQANQNEQLTRTDTAAPLLQQFVAQTPQSPALVLPPAAAWPNAGKPIKALVAGQAMTGSALWSLNAPGDSSASPDGVVQRSDDEGKTWHSVSVDDHSRFYALSSHGSDIWVGGAAGVLFHSRDGGLHWARVNVADENGPMTGSITEIDAPGAGSIKVKAGSAGDWITHDGGLHWRRE